MDPGSVEPAPDPAARLAELAVTADQETVRIGAVELDRRTRTVSIPATVNMLEGVVEYFLVHENGKLHESIFATRAKPEDIHVACLLAGWKPEEKPAAINIRVTWETNGPPRTHRAEELVAIAEGHPNARDGRRIEDGPWQYTGSRIDAAGFVATREGSVIALITDPAALVGNPRPGRHDDSLHTPNRDLLPPQGHPVRILLNRAADQNPPDVGQSEPGQNACGPVPSLMPCRTPTLPIAPFIPMVGRNPVRKPKGRRSRLRFKNHFSRHSASSGVAVSTGRNRKATRTP